MNIFLIFVLLCYSGWLMSLKTLEKNFANFLIVSPFALLLRNFVTILWLQFHFEIILSSEPGIRVKNEKIPGIYFNREKTGETLGIFF